MHSGRITGATNVLGAPQDWSKAQQGPCGSLAIRREKTTAGPGMTSAWFPTAEEIARMIEGAPIYLTIIGDIHPPVALLVGEPTNRVPG
jgi:hypothetical protein